MEMRTELEDFALPEGGHDWAAYYAAQIAKGEKCYQCHALIYNASGERTLCYECRQLETDRDEVWHESFIRCPKCGNLDLISEWDDDYFKEKYEDGDHEVECMECEHRYEIGTNVSYSYTSPPMIEKTNGK